MRICCICGFENVEIYYFYIIENINSNSDFIHDYYFSSFFLHIHICGRKKWKLFNARKSFHISHSCFFLHIHSYSLSDDSAHTHQCHSFQLTTKTITQSKWINTKKEFQFFSFEVEWSSFYSWQIQWNAWLKINANKIILWRLLRHIIHFIFIFQN